MIARFQNTTKRARSCGAGFQPAIRALTLTLFLCLATTALAQLKANPLYEPPRVAPIDNSINYFFKAKYGGSAHWSDRAPKFAVDGKKDTPGAHWAAENTPVHLTVEPEEPCKINTIRLWTYWDNRRFYQYRIEASMDGEEWTLLVDQTKNKTPATAEGETFTFPLQEVREVRVTFTHNSAGNNSGGHIVEIEGYRNDPRVARAEARRLETWAKIPDGLQGAIGSVDLRYERDAVPEIASSENPRLWTGVAWQGERLSAQIALWTRQPVAQLRLVALPLGGDGDMAFASDSFRPAFVRYTLAEGQATADILEPAEGQRLDMPARSTRPVWVSLDIPADAPPGPYKGRLIAEATGGVAIPFDFQVEVLPLQLPKPSDWKFHLDLWQNPYALARYHHVALWSPDHWRLLEPHLRMLAEAGQKCLTATIVHQPWGTQTFDPYDSMIGWTLRRDGSWAWDYTIFDRYVEFGARCGLDRYINCYSMVSWTSKLRYMDETTGDYVEIPSQPGSPSYEKIWRPFLKDFRAHLRERGWLDRTAIAMDERPIKLMRPVIALVREIAPELRIALAGNNEPLLKDDIDDWCVIIDPALDPAIARERAEKGRQTTFYICCNPPRPNTFTNSPPAESAWLGIYAAAQGYSGFLRWAYDSWVDEPLIDTKHVTWTAGDCFLVYPNVRSSIRFERLREGIQEFEKIHILRAAADGRPEAKEALSTLNETLKKFNYKRAQRESAALPVGEAKQAIETLSRAVSKR